MITRQRAFWIMACIAACTLVVTFLISIGATAHSGSAEMAAARTVQCPGPIYQYEGRPIGVPAIVPRNDCTPSFTGQDVVNYVRMHPFPNKGIAANGRLTVTEVAFISVQDIPSARQVGSFDLPGSAVVCYVALHGSVTFTALAAPPSMHTATVYIVFDGRTGNLLGSGS